MKLLTLALIFIFPGILAAEDDDAEVLVERAGMRVMRADGPDDGHRVWVEADGMKADLPASPTELDGKGSSWALLVRPNFALSPDERWLFATQKVVTGYAIGYLYRRAEGPRFQLATKTRFDALAWRFFAKTEGVSMESVLESDSPAHIIDFIAMSDRHLVVGLRGVVPNPPKKSVIKKSGKEEAGVYDWQCVYDLGAGKFALPASMAAHNRTASKRWGSDDGGETWKKSAASQAEGAAIRLRERLDAAGIEQFKEEEAAWRKSLEAKRADANFDEFGEVRAHAVQLELRLLELGAVPAKKPKR